MNTIPKICHLIWTKSPMSLLQLFTVMTFHKYNPDWKIIVHLIEQHPSQLGRNTYASEYTGPNYFKNLIALEYVHVELVDLDKAKIGRDKHGILVSDILRLQILYERGGVYSDFDMLWLRSMDDWSNIECAGNPFDFETTVCLYEEGRARFYNGSIIISEPNGPFLKRLMDEQILLRPPYSHQAFNTDLLNRLFPRSEGLQEQYPRTLSIAYKTFYPYSILNLSKLYVMNDLEPLSKQVMGVHWFNGHDLSQLYIRRNLNRFYETCSMTSILRKEELCF